MEDLLSRFLRYVAVDTMSDESSATQPSTSKQLVLLSMLRDELLAMGVEATLDEYGYVMADIPANTDRDAPPIGFIAHVDTSPDASGCGVKPLVIPCYDGNDVVLNEKLDITMRVADFPELSRYVGQTLIATDGTTLLGADDKAGVAEIMDMVQYLVDNPDFVHGDIKIAFTPDEEIGRGVARFDVSRFGARYAYTVDGGPIGELEYENFYAASAVVRVKGVNIHPGYAKDKMVNSMLVAMELNAMLPEEQQPRHTSGYEGFFHLTSISGTVEDTVLSYIIRDHDQDRFEKKKQLITDAVTFLNAKYGTIVELELTHQYSNMRKEVEPHMFIVDIARQAMSDADVTPCIVPIRGGTDGANLSYMGLPCPNIFTGGHNFHGKYEYIPLQSMHKAVEVLKNIVALFALS